MGTDAGLRRRGPDVCEPALQVRESGPRPVPAELAGLPEPYSGELVLHDLDRLGPGDDGRARAIVVRFLAAQYFANLLRRDWPPHLLRQQRSAALNALGARLVLDDESRWLRRALLGCAGRCTRRVVAQLLRAGAAASSHGYPAGALAICRIAYEAARVGCWWTEAAAAARQIAGSDGLPEDASAGGHWRRRAVALARRAQRLEGVR